MSLEPRIIAPKWAHVSSVQETQAPFRPAYLGADSLDVLDYGNCSLQQLEPGRNENSAGTAGAYAERGQLTAALQSCQWQQGLALVGIVTDAMHFGVSLQVLRG